MRVGLLARTTGEPDWVESSCGVDAGITELQVGRLLKPIAMTAAPYLPPRSLRMHEALLEAFGLRPGLFPGACVRDNRFLLGPLVGVMVRERKDLFFGTQIHKLASVSEEVGCVLFFFQPEDIRLQAAGIAGLAFSPTSGWESRDMPLPDVLYEQTSGCQPKLREYLLHAGVKPLNRVVTADAESLLCGLVDPSEYRVQGDKTTKLAVLMQRDDLGVWHIRFSPDMDQKASVTRLCLQAVLELERAVGCLGEIQLSLTVAATGRCYIDCADLLPDKRLFGDEAFKLPLLFSRRLAGFPPVTDG